MASEITVPRLGWTMEEGTFIGWLKQDGDSVQVGEPLFTLEGDKAAQEIEATESGILLVAPDGPAPGAIVLVGARLGYLVRAGEASPFEATPGRPPVSSTKPREANSGPTPSRSPGTTAAAVASAPIQPPASPPTAQIRISPRALRAAAETGVDWKQIRGTGRTGRIRERDILAATGQPAGSSDLGSRLWGRPPGLPVAGVSDPSRRRSLREPAGQRPAPQWHDANPGRLVPLSPLRRTLARKMSAGVHEAAPVTLTTRAKATALARVRETWPSAADDSSVPTFNDLFAKLAAAALQDHPQLNAQWREDGIFFPNQIHIAIAVETDEGLVAPVLRDVSALTIREVAEASRKLIELARSRQLPPERLQGGTFTITNLGRFGIETFTPILTLPQCAVLGIGQIARVPVVDGDRIVPGLVVPLSLTFDHRVVDGGPAARFLATLRGFIEDPLPHLHL